MRPFTLLTYQAMLPIEHTHTTGNSATVTNQAVLLEVYIRTTTACRRNVQWIGTPSIACMHAYTLSLLIHSQSAATWTPIHSSAGEDYCH